MKLNDRRLDLVSTGLSPRERAVMRLRAFKEDALPGHGRGTTLAIPAGAFADWRGESVPLLPGWGMTFEIFPDEAADQVGRLRTQRETLQKLLDPEEAEDPRLAGLSERITETVAAELTELWAELLALDEVVREVGEEFDGEEPLHPECRALLDETKQAVVALATNHPPSFAELILPTEPAPRVREALTALINQEARAR